MVTPTSAAATVDFGRNYDAGEGVEFTILDFLWFGYMAAERCSYTFVDYHSIRILLFLYFLKPMTALSELEGSYFSLYIFFRQIPWFPLGVSWTLKWVGWIFVVLGRAL